MIREDLWSPEFRSLPSNPLTSEIHQVILGGYDDSYQFTDKSALKINTRMEQQIRLNNIILQCFKYVKNLDETAAFVMAISNKSWHIKRHTCEGECLSFTPSAK